MKIIMGLKRIKHLDRKIEKNMVRIDQWCSYVERKGDPSVPYDSNDIRRMHQQIADWATERARVVHALHVTNTTVTVKYNGKDFTLDELMTMKNHVIPRKIQALKHMRRAQKRYEERGKVVVQFDHVERDKNLDALAAELDAIDTILDIQSIEVDLVE